MNEQREHLLSMLQKLVAVNRDSQKAYLEAAEYISDPESRGFLNDQALEHANYASQLQLETERLGKPGPDRGGTTKGAGRRAWMHLKTATGGGDASILASLAAGEEAARKAYEEALREHLPAGIHTLIERQAETVFAACDHLVLLRERKAA